MMISLPFLILLVLFFGYWHINGRQFGIVSLLLLSYLVMSCAAVLLKLCGKGPSVFPIMFVPMAYFCICLLITFWGFIGFRDLALTSIKIENKYLYKGFETGLLIGGLLAILFFIPHAIAGLTGDIEFNRALTVGYLEHRPLKAWGIINSFFSLLANLFILNMVCAFLSLIPVRGKRKVLKSCLLLVSSFSYVVYILAYVGRDGIVFWLMSFAYCFFLFKDFLPQRDIIKLRYAFAVSLVLLLIPFMAITVSRFSGPADVRFAYSIEGVGWNILSYAGQQIKNFNDHFLIDFLPMYGRLEFPVFTKVIDSLPWFDIPMVDREKFDAVFIEQGSLPWVFTTFIGTLLLDFGRVGTIAFLCLFSLLTRMILHRACTSGTLAFANLIMLSLLYQVVYWGVFYFKQSATNYYIIGVLLCAAAFKIAGAYTGKTVYYSKRGETDITHRPDSARYLLFKRHNGKS